VTVLCADAITGFQDERARSGPCLTRNSIFSDSCSEPGSLSGFAPDRGRNHTALPARDA